MLSYKWNDRFLSMAEMVASWSHDPSTKVGAVIVDDNKIVRGLGYNSFPRGVVDDPKRYENRELKYELIVHAEVNAVLNSTGNLDNCHLYVWPTLMMPNCCPNCAKLIAQTGIKNVYAREKYTPNERWTKYEELTKLIFNEANITCTPV